MATKDGGVEVINPFMETDPIDETGLNSHFRSTFAPRSSSSIGRSASMASSRPPPIKTRERGSSLSERFPGDKSHKPLDIIRRDSKRAHRSPHLTKRHLPGADQIDRLDPTLGASYHHEGPYDAALLSRNTSKQLSPIAALSDSNAEAIRATPRENLRDAIQGHRPLDGVAVIPPGQKDRFGRTYTYREGPNLMVDDGGDYKRWPGVVSDYHPDDIKGKGEPSYSVERALKEHRIRGDDQTGIEMESRPLASGIDQPDYADGEYAARGKRSSLDGIKRRIGSLRRKKD